MCLNHPIRDELLQSMLLCDFGGKLLPAAPLACLLWPGAFVLLSGAVLMRRGADGSECAE